MKKVTNFRRVSLVQTSFLFGLQVVRLHDGSTLTEDDQVDETDTVAAQRVFQAINKVGHLTDPVSVAL